MGIVGLSRYRMLWTLLAGCTALSSFAHPAAAPATPLQSRLAAWLAQPKFAAATWGVLVVSEEDGRTLFEHNAGKLLKPASNAKLYTGALALDRCGPDFKIRTSLRARQRPQANGRLESDLVIYGRGDPSFSARFNEGNYHQSLVPLVQAIQAAGIRHIQGDLVGDDSFFTGPPFGTGWAWEDLQYYYGAEVSALSVDDNTVDLFFSAGPRPGTPCPLTTGPTLHFLEIVNRARTVDINHSQSIDLYRPLGEHKVFVTGQLRVGTTNYSEAVTVPQPAHWLVARLKDQLERGGVKVTGQARRRRRTDPPAPPADQSQWIELGQVESRPMKELVSVMMKHSQNLYAQLLLLQAGAQYLQSHTNSLTTEKAGLAAMREFLSRAGVAPGEVLLEEGAGLSHGAAVTPRATVALLRHMARHRFAPEFQESLPIAGVDGTLRNRLKSADEKRAIRAKPGALRHVSALSGYLTTRGGERLVFSLMLNHYEPPSGEPAARNEVDQIVELLVALEKPIQ